MILTRKEIETLLGESEVMLKGSLKNPKITAYLLNFKYDAPRIAVGEGLHGPFQRCLDVVAVCLIEVDVVGLQESQALFEFGAVRFVDPTHSRSLRRLFGGGLLDRCTHRCNSRRRSGS